MNIVLEGRRRVCEPKRHNGILKVPIAGSKGSLPLVALFDDPIHRLRNLLALDFGRTQP